MIHFMANGSGSARWEVYRTNDPLEEVGTLIGYTQYFDITVQTVGTTSKTYNQYFNPPIEIGGAYYYRFVLAPVQGSQVNFYSKTSGSVPASLKNNIYSLRCNNSFTSECDGIGDSWVVDIWSPSGTSTPSVAFSYQGGVVSGEYITTNAPCTTHSDTQPNNSCNASVPLTEVTVSGFVNMETANKKVSIYLKDKFLNNLDSVALYYTGAGYEQFTHTFDNLSASTTYNIQTCLSDSNAFPDFAINPTCTTIIYTNGDNPVSYEQYWCELFPTDPTCLNATSTPTLWTDLGCSDIGITDVKLGVQCALVWAFEPSQNSIRQFERAKDAILYSIPIGYATYMIQDVQEAFTSTDTSVFNREIELGKYFGKPNTATTTISLEGLTEYTSMIDPVWDLIETILWLAFAVWFIYWALTRTL